MISLEVGKVTWNHPLELSLERDFWIFSIRFPNYGAYSKLTLAYSLIASCISSWHRNGHIIPAFFVYHILALHLHKSLHYHTSAFSMLFCSGNCIHYIFIVCMSCSLMHDPCIFLYKKIRRGKTKQKNNKSKKKVNIKGHTTFLVTCVGYHDNGYKPTMLGLYTHF